MSPFEIFRRNLKPLMILLTGLALFAFVVLPVVDSYMRKSSGGSVDSTVARVGGQDISRSRVDYFTQNHYSTIRFLGDLAQLTIDRGGQPQTPGFQYDTQNRQIRSLGINQNPNVDSTVRTLMLANEATDAGFELDDNTLQVWMEQFTNGMLSDAEINGLLMQTTQNRMARPHLYEQLRHHLLADVYLRRGNAGLYSSGPMGGPLMTPSEQWESFLKLNQKATATSYGVLVNDYLEDTNKAPSESEVLALYEEGKDRDSSDQSPEPGFHRRYTARFEYLVGSYQTFLDEEIAKLEEDDIRAEYERRLKGGDFQLPEENPAASETEPAAEEETETADEPGNTEAAEDTGSTEDAGAMDKAEPVEEVTESTEVESTEEMKTDADEMSEEAKSEEPAEDMKPAEEVESKIEELTESTEDAGASDIDEAGSSDQTYSLNPTGIRLVAFQEDGDTENKKETKVQEKKSGNEDGDMSSDVEPQAKDDEMAEAENTADAEAPAAEAEDAADAEDTSQPEESMTAESSASDEGEKPKVETFEDVRDQIAAEMAGPAARKRMDIAVSTINKEMRRYFTLRSIGGATAPAKPDLEALAKEYGFKRESIGPYNSETIVDEPIANSHDVGTQFGQRGPSFQIMMYGFDNGRTQLPPQVLYSPIRTADDPAGKIYISWKIEETEAYTPSLDEVRDEVVMALRMKEARVLATEAAQAIAKEANESGKSLADLVPEDKADNIVEIAEPFSWLDSFGLSGATIGNVPQLDSVGTEFMRSTFSAEPGQYAVALNEPQRVVYVVSPKEFKPSIDELQVQFRQPTNRMMAMMVGGSDVGPIVSGFFEAIDEKSGYEKFEDE